MPRFFKKRGYVTPTDPSNVPLQDAFNFKGDIFALAEAFPEKGELFDRHMKLSRDCFTNWSNITSILQEREQSHADEVVFVDVGGGVGHQCARLKAHYPNLSGRVVLQDLERVIHNASPIPGIEMMAYDIFTVQPIKGSIYFREDHFPFNTDAD
jgi:demethylsterigmatocystin 6-O-methyltransferase